VSHNTEVRPCHERNVLVHCLAGRQTRLQQCCNSLAAVPASATLLGNTASCWFVQTQWKWDWYNRVLTLQQRPYRLAESGMYAQKTADTDVALFTISDHFVSSLGELQQIENMCNCSCECLRLKNNFLNFSTYSGYILYARWKICNLLVWIFFRDSIYQKY